MDRDSRVLVFAPAEGAAHYSASAALNMPNGLAAARRDSLRRPYNVGGADCTRVFADSGNNRAPRWEAAP